MQRAVPNNQNQGKASRYDYSSQANVVHKEQAGSAQQQLSHPYKSANVSQLEKDRSLFNEKLERLKIRLNAPSSATSVEAFPAGPAICSGPQT